MSNWSNNNRAHTQTWHCLLVLDQLAASFPEAKSMSVNDLTFWSTAASAELRLQQAQAIAIQLDNMFTKIYRAKYEEGVGREDAVAALEGALSDGETTIPKLGEVADAIYQFLGEATDG